MRQKVSIDEYQWFLIPCVGIINERFYYGYNVFSLAFAWLRFRCKVTFGIKRWRTDNGQA